MRSGWESLDQCSMFVLYSEPNKQVHNFFVIRFCWGSVVRVCFVRKLE